MTVRARADAAAGDNFGFVVLRRGDITRRIPYYFAVTRPGLELRPAAPLREFNTGDTRDGVSHASAYRFPSWPFGPPADYPSGAAMIQDGAEDLYTALLDEPVVNFGAAVWLSGDGALIDPWILGSADENDVQGQGATPVNVNNFTFGYRLDVGAAALTFPRPKRYWISVDSGRDRFTGVPQHGPYVLKAWQNDVYPPLVAIVSARVTAGHPLVIARVLDYPASGRDSGIDPTSLVISYRRALVGASAYDPLTGYAIFGLPTNAPRVPLGRTNAMILAADFQEAKNVSTPGGSILPNTTVATRQADRGRRADGHLARSRAHAVRQQPAPAAARRGRLGQAPAHAQVLRRQQADRQGRRYRGAAVRVELDDAGRQARPAHAHGRRARRRRP